MLPVFKIMRLAVLAGACLLSAATPAEEPAQANEIAVTAEQAEAQGIRTTAPVAVTGGTGAGFPAKAVIPNAQLRVVSASLEGIVETMLYAAGQPVRKGQVVAELKSPALIDEERQFLQAASAAGVARTARDRDAKLLKEGIIAKSRGQSSGSSYQQAEAELSEKRQALALYGMSPVEIAALEKTRRITDTLRIVSPLDGFVLEQAAIAGQRVEAASPLYRIGALDPMWVEIALPAPSAARIEIGDRVRVEEAKASGRVISIGRSLNATNQTITVRAEMTGNATRLVPEQLVVATIETGAAERKLWQVPAAAVTRQNGKPYVFIAIPKGFRAMPVEVENESASATFIAAPLKASDKVVAQGLLSVKGRWQGLGGGE